MGKRQEPIPKTHKEMIRRKRNMQTKTIIVNGALPKWKSTNIQN